MVCLHPPPVTYTTDCWRRYQGLPPPIQFSDTALPTRELPFVVQGRALEIRCSLYRPFLYFAIHHDSARSDPLHDLLRPLVDKALTWHLRYIDLHPTTHRHHGTWYELRSCIANCLCVMAAARSDAVVMPRPPQAWRAAVARCMDRMAYWEDEAPGIRRGVEIVNKVLSECP